MDLLRPFRGLWDMLIILYVADHPASLFSLSLILRSKGYRCITAEDAEIAARLHQKHQVDVLIVDHDISGFQGCEVAETLRQIREVPVILLSGSPDLREKPLCADVLLPKPVSPEVLLSEIATLLATGSEERLCM